MHHVVLQMHVLLFYPPVVLSTVNSKDTTAASAATSTHSNAADKCSKKDYKNGVCTAAVAPAGAAAVGRGRGSDIGTDLDSATVNASNGAGGEGHKEDQGEGEAGVNVQPLKAMEKIIRGSAENFRGRCGTMTLNFLWPLYILCLYSYLPL